MEPRRRRTRSLRTTVVAGTTVVAALVASGLAAAVWMRARSEAERSTRAELELAARTLGSLLEMEPGGHEFEMPSRVLPEYESPEGGAFLCIVDANGKTVVRSPSLAGADLAPAGAWQEGAVTHACTDSGPGGRPCASATWSFVVPAEDPGPAAPDWIAPPREARRYRAVVARDVSLRDGSLRRLAAFLAAAAAASAVAAAGGSLLVARAVLRPVRRMTEDAAALTPDAPGRRLDPSFVVAELSSLAATLNDALDRLTGALDRERRFTADASHELRTPLAVLKSGADLLLRRDRTPEEYREGLERQRRVISDLIAVAENLLRLARHDAGSAPAAGPVDLAAAAQVACGSMATAAADAGVTIERDAGGEVAAAVDPAEAAQVFSNLLSNAVRFSPRGAAVRVTVRRDADRARIEVADRGPGIPASERELVFDRFHRVHGGDDRREGAGLGLAIVAAIARARGGRVEALENPGGGALLRVEFPLSAASGAATR